MKTKKTRKGLGNVPQLSISIAFVVVFIVFSLCTSSFLTSSNIVNMLRQSSTNLIIAIGMTYVLILGGIDLSVGSIACLSAIVGASLMTGSTGAGTDLFAPLPLLPSMLVAVVLAALCGLLNGLVITRLSLPPFIVTMAMQSIARGVALVYSGGYPVSALPETATQIARGDVIGIPYTGLIMAVILAMMWFILRCSKFGRYVFAIGGNEECARLSGVKVKTVKVIVYAVSGIMSGLAGLLVAFKMASAQPTLGNSYELDAITAVALGGTSLAGGKGNMLGTVIGCLFLTVLSTGFTILSISPYWQQIFKGIILIIAISLYREEKSK